MTKRAPPTADEHQPLEPAPSGDGGPSTDEDGPVASDSRHLMPPIAWAPLARAVRTSLGAVVLVVVVSVALGTTAFVTATFYGQYGAVRNGPNARAWAALAPRIAGPALCTSCHATQAHAQDASIHVNVSCEDCHGPAAAHSSSTAAARATVLTEPTSGICVTCHAATAGRPKTFPQVDPSGHYRNGVCLRCHDPHSIVAVRPPTVSHPLANLPECTTCHSPDGLKKVPTGHEIVGDPICLSCHRPEADGAP